MDDNPSFLITLHKRLIKESYQVTHVKGPFSVLLGRFYCITGLSLCEIHKIK